MYLTDDKYKFDCIGKRTPPRSNTEIIYDLVIVIFLPVITIKRNNKKAVNEKRMTRIVSTFAFPLYANIVNMGNSALPIAAIKTQNTPR